ncbi:NAD(P)H-hydrate dehydratase [Candidatus Venteria ishoeyi]|uniref:NAD(P)H-hydrate dehydratase n=1 Tax=Candidatus Venteria ishoeyi TaxID=1899563 RepID=UPI0025A6788C|nr:NAD(P)H-hydrate dehydratase [Candidatus Venteria ishoeyi]MDM8548003.1 NAD(P)H-hydrate dehydratase [Candidatus Venteria ishoeyi]
MDITARQDSLNLLPQALYRAAQSQAIDQRIIQDHGMSGLQLMERAGTAAFNCLQAQWPENRHMTVFCGVGNNGGDGYILAQLARRAGYRVVVLQLGDTAQMTQEARDCLSLLERSGIHPKPFDGTLPEDTEIFVDALLGTGLKRPVTGEWAQAIELLNAHPAPVLSLDIPSGLNADSGSIMGTAVRADMTVSFITLKRGTMTGAGSDLCGILRYNDLHAPLDVFEKIPAQTQRLGLDTLKADLQRFFPPRRRNTHKGDYGSLLLIGGDWGMSGAVQLAARAAARCGTGKIRIATRREHADILNLQQPELMCSGIETTQPLEMLFAQNDVIAIGPGMGQFGWAQQCFDTLLQDRQNNQKPWVLDADALNLLAKKPMQPMQLGPVVLTPHPGEAARLLGCSIQEVQQDRFNAVVEIQQRYGGVCVLKGSGSLIADGGEPLYVCYAGNPGMASGGMGDLLTGLIAGLLAQKVPLAAAARLGVCLHACAGDICAQRDGERGLLAKDLLPEIRHLLML